MAPRNVDVDVTPAAADNFGDQVEPVVTEVDEEKRPPMQIVWHNVIWFGLLHTGAVYGLICLPFTQPLTWFWSKSYRPPASLVSTHTVWNKH